MIMTLTEFLQEFDKLRLIVNEAIRYEKEIMHEPGKFYEGEWELKFHYPGFDDDYDGTAYPDGCEITLHCYLIGPSRHYEWSGTLYEAMARCRKEVMQWCKEVYDDAK